MKSFTLCLLVLPRTGTTTIWFSYGRHPEISRSRQKEPLFGFSEENKQNYIENNYFINNNTKVLLDGTVALLVYTPEIIYKLKSIQEINRICCIYTTRDPYRRVRSNIYNYLRNHLRFRLPKPNFLNDDNTINEKELKNFVSFLLNEEKIITNLISIIGNENIIIIKTDDMFEKQTQEKVFNFLQLQNHYIRGPILNSSNRLIPTVKQLKIYTEIMNWFNKNDEYIQKLVEKDKKYMKKTHNILI